MAQRRREEPQAAQDGEQQQTAQDEPQVSGKDWEKAIAERDGRIAEFEVQVSDAAKNAEAAEQLRGQIAELKAQGESDRIDFQLQLAGVRNVKAARAILDDHGGDVEALKEAEPCGCLPMPPPSRRAARRGFPTQAPRPTPART